ncbi:hypothetical protein AWN76_011415 [Rhodothermaceae bacterium RA]|nr:hypothetical protein AWN76_011415 [Rhodothermaceae bacterium RA]
MPRLALLATALIAALAAPIWTGCDDRITAVVGTDRAFTLYGVLTPEADTQWVRVFPIQPTLAPGSPDPLQARVTSADLSTGETRVWTGTTLTDPRGRVGYFYWAPFRVRYGHTYRLSVEQPEGAGSHVTVPVPPRTEIVQHSLSTRSSVILTLAVPGAPRLNRLELTYRIKFGLGEGTELTVPVAYGDRLVQRDGAWLIPIDLTADYVHIRDLLRTTLRFDPSFGVVLQYLSVRFMVTNAAWDPPGGTFDPDVLVQPEMMSNVENGFGFVGAGYRLSRSWLPDSAATVRAGFRWPDGVTATSATPRLAPGDSGG